MKIKAIYAWWNLAYHFLIHLGRLLFFRKSPNLKSFLSFYRADGIVCLTEDDKEKLIHFSRCIGCSLCDAACPASKELSQTKFPGPSALVKCLSRSMVDCSYVPLIQDFCEACEGCEDVCPEGIPIREVWPLIRKKQGEQLSQD